MGGVISEGSAGFCAILGGTASSESTSFFPLSPGTMTMGLLGGVALRGTQSGVLGGTLASSFPVLDWLRGMSCSSVWRSLDKGVSSISGKGETAPLFASMGPEVLDGKLGDSAPFFASMGLAVLHGEIGGNPADC